MPCAVRTRVEICRCIVTLCVVDVVCDVRRRGSGEDGGIFAVVNFRVTGLADENATRLRIDLDVWVYLLARTYYACYIRVMLTR